jgi:hypothetical protein
MDDEQVDVAASGWKDLLMLAVGVGVVDAVLFLVANLT